MDLIENKPLAPFTTFEIGGPARWFVEAVSEEEIVEATTWAQEHSLPLFVLGGGSNLLVADAGFSGLVLKISLRGVTAVPGQSGQTIYQAAAGEDFEHCVQRTIEDGCAGLECLAGIPGTVGGTPVQNVGAYGQEVASSIERVRAYDLASRAFVEFNATECGFSYRRSRFNSVDRDHYIVTRVDYRLTPGGAPTLRYVDLQRAFAGVEPTLVEVAAQVRHLRQSKGMLLVEDDPNCRSAGSFFKNPVVDEDQYRQIAAASPTVPPRFPAGPDQVKIPAAWLIEQSGFPKGYRLGPAAVSSRHTLALINLGASVGRSASASDILALAAQIKAAVQARFNLQLEIEPVLLGF
jgi:UDP-N-acetylmuramate dehydrogenase